jgi:type I restriction enzyme S subunit
MEHLFTKGTRGEPTKMTEIGEMPESWEAMPVRYLGAVHTGTTPRTADAGNYGDEHPFITPGDIDEGQYVTHVARRLSDQGLAQSRPLPRDSVLVVCIGATIGKVGMSSEDVSATNQQINALVVSGGHDARFAYYSLSHRAPVLPRLAGRAAVPIVKKSTFCEFLIPVAPSAEQSRVADALGASDGRVVALANEIALLDELFKALLEELMTGRRSAVPLIEGGTAEPNGGE